MQTDLKIHSIRHHIIKTHNHIRIVGGVPDLTPSTLTTLVIRMNEMHNIDRENSRYISVPSPPGIDNYGSTYLQTLES